MSLKDKCSNPLVCLVIFLVVFVIALLTTVIVLKIDSEPIVIQKEPLVSPKENDNGTSQARPSTLKPSASDSGNVEEFKSSPDIVIGSVSTTETLVTGTESVAPVTVKPNIPTLKSRNVCETPECITLAHQLLNWHDPSIDPCVDFYKSACGKYNEHTVVEGTRNNKKSIIVQNLIEEFLQTDKNPATKTERTFKLFYKKCEELKDGKVHKFSVTQNAEIQYFQAMKRNSKQALKDIFGDIKSFGSWPLAEKRWSKSKFNLNDMLSNIARSGELNFGLFQMNTAGNKHFSISPIFERQQNENLKETIKSILTENGIKVFAKTLNDDFQDYEDFIKVVDQNDYIDEEKDYKLPHLEKKIPSIDFGRIIENLVNPKKKTNTTFLKKIEDMTYPTDQLLFFDKKKNLEKILKKTSARTLANFLIFHFINLSSQDLSIYPTDIKSTDCAETAINSLNEAALSAFINNHFDKENLEIVSEMVEETKENFIEMIQESTWLHEETKKAAILKVEKIKKTIGYPKEFKVPGSLDKAFKNVCTHISSLNILPSDSFYTMIRKVERVRTELIMDFVGLETELDPSVDLLETNAFYDSADNSLTILIPFLDDPLFDSTFPKYAKIAGTGNTLSHEIGHGFDMIGRTSDENGVDKDWWAKEDLVEYDKRAKCLINQYSNYDDPDFGRKLNGSTTIDEIIADGLGVETSWRAFKKLDLSKEQKIVGFDNHSIAKVYFRIAALEFCRKRDTSSLEEQLEKEHPTDSFRVNGVFSNMKAFGETFECPVGSPMNPKRKCELF
ncbi:hypothetical protein CRE_06586 [Caenorhabditis remanei]|uniref:Peptidase M13 C-terminal domain-containing protein n=1 Tax=Caenorhabditis remanei TaxID=31234 RepID=E3M1N6_CAERE|nr:hypothetical protein CRE_06586 [Caenorhabditis remanei]